MLSAVDKHGKSVVLAGPNAKLLALRLKKTPHFCPQCARPVVVKAGDVNIPHFAHESISSCHSFSEHESPRHLAGKSHLFEWITKTHSAQMEARLPDGLQRPDILSGRIAIEFQCSTISAALFKKRTDYFKRHGITPFWIYGGKPVQQKNRFIKLTPFQRLFLRYQKQLGFYLVCYCPDTKLFTIYGRIVPFTATLCTAERLDIPLGLMAFPPAAAFSSVFSFHFDKFLEEKRKWIERSLFYTKARSHPFFKTVYESGANPYLLPEHVGIPVRSGIAIRNHPVEWQFYIMLDSKKYSAAESIRRRIEMGHLKEQMLPLAESMTAEQAAEDYIHLLAELKGSCLSSSRSMGEKLRNEETFQNTYGEQIRKKLIF